MRILSLFGIAVTVAAVCAAAVLVTRSADGSRSLPASCPERWGGADTGGWVPEAAEVDGAEESLVPGEPGVDNDLLQADLDDRVRDQTVRFAPPAQ
ncbi:hypothetical protein [Planotetraspora sp. GP83]|uniref:hypothetical protein n=1 Tax=Planotetraspora sp. GP83 TaxID=3156264 RepID=UPI0035144A8C